MTSSKPYLIIALQEWILDNGMTPHLLINTSIEGVSVPVDYVKSNQIVLSIHPTSIHNLDMSNDVISFSASFNGSSFNIVLPMRAIVSIYAKESGKGMVFKDDEPDKTEIKKPGLRLVTDTGSNL